MNEMQMIRSDIEGRIAYHMNGAYRNIIAVGECLIEAKERGVVAHGEWTEWVSKQTGFSERQAQRLMQAAREVGEGSTLAQLPISKITTILSLPASEREAVAEKAVKEDMTVRELRDEVARLKSKEATTDRQLKTLLHQQDKKERETNEALKEVDRLRGVIDDLEAREPQGFSEEAKAEIKTLKEQLRDAEADADRQAELRQKAQQELINMQASSGTSGGDQADAAEVIEDLRRFIGTCSAIPHMVATMSDKDRQMVGWYVGAVDKWVCQMRQALGVVEVVL